MPEAIEGRRCQAHGLAAGPDGQCVICRRPPQAVEAQELPATPPSYSLLTSILAVCALGSLGVLAWAWGSTRQDQRAHALDAAALQAQSPRGAQLIARRQPPPPLAAKPDALSQQQASHKSDPSNALRDRQLQLEAAQRQQAEEQRQAEQVEQDRRRHAQIEADLNVRALAAARHNVSIEMYSTSWCGACARARQYMRDQNLSFTDHDIEQDEAARSRAHLLNPRLSVPVLDVEGDVSVGFSAPALEASLDHAARKRTGL